MGWLKPWLTSITLLTYSSDRSSDPFILRTASKFQYYAAHSSMREGISAQIAQPLADPRHLIRHAGLGNPVMGHN
ncbi:hypothetical protein C8R43DRAFT_483848 [Mycena crocata]|nr:hypothetical protein C8R43DRAFT_483848 [Mycena crocata]